MSNDTKKNEVASKEWKEVPNTLEAYEEYMQGVPMPDKAPQDYQEVIYDYDDSF